MFHKRMRLLFTIFFLLTAGFSFSGSVEILSTSQDAISISYGFDKFSVKEEKGYHYFSEESCIDLLEEGKPVVPVRIAKILIPNQRSLGKISVNSSPGKYRGRYNLDTAQRQVRIGEQPFARADFSGIFPIESYELLSIERCMGYSIAVIRLFPFFCNTETGEVSYACSIRLDITFTEEAPGKSSNREIRVRGREKDMEYVSGLVDNGADIAGYASSLKNIYPLEQTYDYLIITNSTLKDSFQPFANYIQANRGLSVGIFDVDDIYNIGRPYYQAGRDNQERIRNFIKYAYNTWQTQYVLLGGYANIIPVRYLDTYDGPVPGDVYYSNLDGDWDYNGNNTFGEYNNDGPGGGRIDSTAEVFLGRAPVATPQEVANFTAKVISYNQTGNWKLKKSAFIGRRLNMNTPSWGGDGLDGIIRDCMPEDWEVRRFYDRDNTFDVSEILSYINSGVQLVGGLVHGSPATCNGLSIANILSMRNTDYFINYSQSCNSGAYDTPADGRCIAEYMVNEPYAAVAFIGNARSGYYSPSNEEFGSSNVLHKEFCNLLFNQNVTILGEVYQKHKDNFRNNMNGSTLLYYYVHLFGDPSMPIMEPRISPPAMTEGFAYYIKNDDIWRHDLATGERLRVTYFGNGSGTIQNPSVTEDGEKIVFARSTGGNYSLFQINSDGSGLENLTEKWSLSSSTTNQTYGTLSSNGEILAFTAASTGSPFGGIQLWTKELTGSERLRQLTFQNWNCSYPLFVDDNTLLFKTSNIDDLLEDYYLITAVGTNLTNRTNNNPSSPYFPRLGRPSLDRDKTRIIYAKQTQTIQEYSDWSIYTRPVWTGAETTVLTNLYYIDILPENQPDPMPVFVTGGSLIFSGISSVSGDQYLYHTVFNSTSPYLTQLNNTLGAAYHSYFLPSAKPVQFAYIKEGQVYLRNYWGTDIKLTDTVNANDDPVFDFTGVYIAYSGNGIWVMKANGTENTQIETAFTSRYPAFSPDGKWLAYVKNNDIYARKTDMTVEPQKLTSSLTLAKSDISFSPDGKKILYTMRSGGISRIYSLPVSIFDTYIRVDGEPLNLTDTDSYNNYHGRWSYTGEHIIYISTAPGSPAIYTMNSDGSEKQQLQLTQMPVNPSFPLFSPYAESRIAYINNGNVWLADLDRQSEEITSPAVIATQKFGWAQYKAKIVDARRQFMLKQADPSVDFVYNIIITENELNPSGILILTETLPEIPDSGVNWLLDKATWNGQEYMPTNGAVTGTLKWILGTDTPLESTQLSQSTSGVMALTLKLTGDGPAGSIRSLNGGIFNGDKYFTISGDAYLEVGNPVMPVDTDEPYWQIDDFELLVTIDYWATNSRMNGWPVDTEDWDMYLLLIIDFWSNDGYEYVPGESRWRIN